VAVRAEALRLLMLGQHREVAMKAAIEALDVVRAELARLSKASGRGKPNPGERSIVQRFDELLQFGRALCSALGRLPDDRSVDALVDFSAKVAEGLRARFAETVARSLAQLGTREAWKGAVALLPFLEGKEGRRSQRSADPVAAGRKSPLRKVHDVLVGAARAVGHDDVPSWSAKPASDWRAWSKRHQGDFPAKLGRVSPSAAND
jgi:hypothetical protein